jgi:U3 small nucleolar RNA-associated protein 15
LNQDPDHTLQTLTVLTALTHRSALRTALSNRDELTLQPLFRFLIKSISDTRVTRLITDVALLVLDLYADQLGKSEVVDMLVEQLHQRVRVMAEASQLSWSVLGMCELLVAEGAGVGDGAVAV